MTAHSIHPLLVLALAALLPGQGATRFTDATAASLVNFVHTDDGSRMPGGGCLFDYDNDGDQDLFLTHSAAGNKNVLYRNNGNGTFTDVSAGSGLDFVGFSTGAYAADLDNNGLQDLLLLGTFSLKLLRNDGGGKFTDVSASAGIVNQWWAMAASFGDFDKDGLLDIYVGNYVADGFIPHFDGGPNRLFRNNGNLTFTDVAFAAGVTGQETFWDTRGFFRTTFACTLSVLFFDYDRDGWPDILSGNDFGPFVIPDQLFRNNRDGTFTEVSASAGFRIAEFNMGLATADVNGDGVPDIYTTNLGDNHLLFNDGNGRFNDVNHLWNAAEGTSAGKLLTSWACLFLDADLDTRIDLYVSNGHIPTIPSLDNDPNAPSRLLYHRGFDYLVTQPAVFPWDTGLSRGAMRGDLDNDGDEDVVLINNGGPARIFGNQTVTQTRSLTLDLRGTLSNRDAVGSVVKIRGRQHLQVLDYTRGGSYLSCDAAPIVRGLGGDERAEQVAVTWPSGVTSRVHALAGNRRHEIVEPAVVVTAIGRSLPIGSDFVELPITVRNHSATPELVRFAVTLTLGDVRAPLPTYHFPATLGVGATATVAVYIPLPWAAVPFAQQLGVWVNVEARSRGPGRDQLEQPLR
jgi:hypothetical protein